VTVPVVDCAKQLTAATRSNVVSSIILKSSGVFERGIRVFLEEVRHGHPAVSEEADGRAPLKAGKKD
jgi:hypothetical protein